MLKLGICWEKLFFNGFHKYNALCLVSLARLSRGGGGGGGGGGESLVKLPCVSHADFLPARSLTLSGCYVNIGYKRMRL